MRRPSLHSVFNMHDVAVAAVDAVAAAPLKKVMADMIGNLRHDWRAPF